MKTFSDRSTTGAAGEQQDGGGAVPRAVQGGAREGAPGPGRPSGCTPVALGLLRGVIRETGVSDSAAAVRMGLGASTLSRWKREDPEVRAFLQQAREECRALQLQKILEAAAAENGRGWRAAAWLLERLFPEDYAANAGAREGHRQVAERRAEREERALEEEERQQRDRWRRADVPQAVVPPAEKTPAGGEAGEGGEGGAGDRQPRGGEMAGGGSGEAGSSAGQGRMVIPMPQQVMSGGASIRSAGLDVSPGLRTQGQPSRDAIAGSYAPLPGEKTAPSAGTGASHSSMLCAQLSPCGC